LKGARRFLDELWRLQEKVNDIQVYSEPMESIIHKTIKGVSEDIEQMKFNTAISKLMIAVNEATSASEITRKDLETLTILSYPFAPHITSEIFEAIGNKASLVFTPWPTYDDAQLIDKQVVIVINVNGKIRDKMVVNLNTSQEELQAMALASEKIQAHVQGQTIKKVIIVPNKLVNIVI